MSYVDGGAAVITHPSTGLCLQRMGDSFANVQIHQCDTGNPAQRWVPVR